MVVAEGEPVSAADSVPFHRPLSRIAVDGQSAVGDVDILYSSLVAGVEPSRANLSEDARLSVFRYIETFYNSQHLHQTLGYHSSNTFEALCQADNAPASAA